MIAKLAHPCGGQLRALLGPDRSRMREYPCRTLTAVERPADQSRSAVGRQRHAHTEVAMRSLVICGQYRSLLDPGRTRVGEHPRVSRLLVDAGIADQAVLPSPDKAPLWPRVPNRDTP